jgi:hypothetical protein
MTIFPGEFYRELNVLVELSVTHLMAGRGLTVHLVYSDQGLPHNMYVVYKSLPPDGQVRHISVHACVCFDGGGGAGLH